MRIFFLLSFLFTFLYSQEIEEEEVIDPSVVEEIYESKFIKVNVNTASLEELMEIEGIDKRLAKKIIRERKRALFISFDDFFNRLKLSDDYLYLQDYLSFSLNVLRLYSETKGIYRDYERGKYYRVLKGKVRAQYGLLYAGAVHYDFREIDKYFLNLKYKKLNVIAGYYTFIFGKGFIFGKSFAFSSELFKIPYRFYRVKPTLSYSWYAGEKGAFISYEHFNLGYAYNDTMDLVFMVPTFLQKFSFLPLIGFYKYKKHRNLNYIFSISYSFFGPVLLFSETGFTGNSIYTWTGFRKSFGFSKLYFFYYNLPKKHFNYFNTKYDMDDDGADEKGTGIRWEGKFERLFVKIEQRFFESSEMKGGHESFLRGYFKINKNLSYMFEIKDRKTSIHRLRLKNEFRFRKKDKVLKLKLYFEWDNYIRTAAGVLGGMEMKFRYLIMGFYSFNIRDYSKRIYIYEAEPPSSFYLEPFYGNGSRGYIGIVYRTPALYIFLKYSQNFSDTKPADRRIALILSLTAE